jgi:DNA-binding beta-propeller fold protein YncE
VSDEIALGGFGSGIAVGEGAVWVVVDNRELLPVDAESGEPAEDSIEVPDALDVAIGAGSAWVITASGTVTRIDLDPLAVAGQSAWVRGAVGVAVGERGVWVTSADRTVTRLDPATGEIMGDPVDVGDEPASIAVGEGAVWVANGGDGTVTRIQP